MTPSPTVAQEAPFRSPDYQAGHLQITKILPILGLQIKPLGVAMSRRALTAFAIVLYSMIVTGPLSAEAGSALDKIKTSGVLVVATDPDWAPMSWRKDNGDFDGF